MKSDRINPPGRFSLLSLVAVLLTGLSTFTIATAADASGKWKWTYNLQNGETIEASVNLKQQGNQLTGSYESSRGGESPVRKGKIEGNNISFVVNRQIQDREIKLSFNGKLADDTITGSVTVGEDGRDFDWEAKRVAAPSDPTGIWKWSFTRPNGQTVENTLTLKREGDRLVGSIQGSQGREIPIREAKISGNELSFKVSRQVREGRTLEMEYRGKIQENKVTGEITMRGGNGERTREWTATRAEPEVNVSGKWDFSVTVSDDRTLDALLDLNREGRTLTGSLQGDSWELPISEGKVEGDTISFTTVRQLDDGGRIVYKSTGKVSGNRIHGKVNFETPEGEARTLDWKATRR